MPQLIPDPWFFIFFFSWMTVLILAPQKILNHTILNEPTSKTSKTTHNNWIWPWS